MFVAGLDLSGRSARGRRCGGRAADLLLPPVRPGHGYRRRGRPDRGGGQGADLVAARPLRSSPPRSRPPAATTGAGCHAPPPSPARSSATRSPGARPTAASRTCGSSTRCSPAWPASTPATASSRAGGRRSSPRWPTQDRCHLNGLAMRDGSPAFVTVMAPTDEPGRVAQRRATTAAPCSTWPRARRSPPDSPCRTPRAGTTGTCSSSTPAWVGSNASTWPPDTARTSRSVPGYARGLAFHGDLAFVGLSRIRETAIFGGVTDRGLPRPAQVWRRGHRAQHRQHGRDAAVRQRRGGDLRRADRPRRAVSDLRRLARRRRRDLAAPGAGTARVGRRVGRAGTHRAVPAEVRGRARGPPSAAPSR